ncbi:MAG: NAD(P)H-dependent oxidoreductase [Desulfatirhabdiaceae bacterium]
MFVLGLQGSPRRKGNTHYLLTSFLKEAEKLGARTAIIEVDKKHIVPCKEYVVCEKKGFCPIDDDMKTEIYPLLRQADVVVAATPVFFYNTTAQLKALIDRTQTLWARKYRLNLTDPNRKWRKGFVLAMGATRGKNLFEGLHLTAKYFFDAVGASYDGSLTYWQIEKPGDMAALSGVEQDVQTAVTNLISPLLSRKIIVFVDQTGSCAAPMAWAWTQFLAGDRVEAQYAAVQPVDQFEPAMMTAMHEKGIDMEFRGPVGLNVSEFTRGPDQVIVLGETVSGVPSQWNALVETWNIPIADEIDSRQMELLRDNIEAKVKDLIHRL